MNKLVYICIALLLLCSCNNRAKLEKEAQDKIEADSKAHSLAEEREWRKVERLVNKATGLTTTSKQERKLALVELLQMFPKNERWEAVNESIEKGDFYQERDDLIFEIKESKGWKDAD